MERGEEDNLKKHEGLGDACFIVHLARRILSSIFSSAPLSILYAGYRVSHFLISIFLNHWQFENVQLWQSQIVQLWQLQNAVITFNGQPRTRLSQILVCSVYYNNGSMKSSYA